MQQIIRENVSFFDWWSKSWLVWPIDCWLFWIQKKVVKEVTVTKSSLVLDVGCGAGRALELFQRKSVKNVYGVDISPKMLQEARKRLGKKTVLKRACADQLPFQDNSFDIVTTMDSFHHFPNPEKAVREIYRVTQSKGRVYLADLNFFLPQVHWLFKKLEPGHVKIYGKKELYSLLTKAGFSVVRQQRFGLFVILTIGEKL